MNHNHLQPLENPYRYKSLASPYLTKLRVSYQTLSKQANFDKKSKFQGKLVTLIPVNLLQYFEKSDSFTIKILPLPNLTMGNSVVMFVNHQRVSIKSYSEIFRLKDFLKNTAFQERATENRKKTVFHLQHFIDRVASNMNSPNVWHFFFS